MLVSVEVHSRGESRSELSPQQSAAAHVRRINEFVAQTRLARFITRGYGKAQRLQRDVYRCQAPKSCGRHATSGRFAARSVAGVRTSGTTREASVGSSIRKILFARLHLHTAHILRNIVSGMPLRRH